MIKHAWYPLLFLAAGASAPATQPDNPPDLTEARVTIPYAELKELWQAAQGAKAAGASRPPVEAALLSAHYQLAFAADQVEGVAEYETQSFDADWTTIPLIGAEAQIESINPPDAQILLRDGHYALVTHGLGKQTVKIQFAAKMTPSSAGPHLRLPISPASINTLLVTGIPENEVASVAGTTQIAAGKNQATFRLPARNQIDVDFVAKESLAPPMPSSWKIDPQIFVRLGDGRLSYRARLAAQADNGSGLSMELEIPPGATVSKITSIDLAESRIATGEDGKRVARLRWETRNVLRREIEIEYDLPEPPAGAEWKLESPRLAHGESTAPLYAIVPEQGLELTAAEAQPPRQMPQWLADCVAGKSFLVFTGDAPLRAKWLPLVQTARAVVEHEEAEMRIVGDGAVLTETAYAIRHEGALAWRLDVPPGSELLACSVDGKAVNPVSRGEHLIEFSLPSSSAATQVKVSYTGRKPAFSPVWGSSPSSCRKRTCL